MPADEFDRGNDALDFRHVTTLWVKTTFSPANTVTHSRSGENVSVYNVRQEAPRFSSAESRGHPYPDESLSK